MRLGESKCWRCLSGILHSRKNARKWWCVCICDFPFDNEARRPEIAHSKYESPYRILYHPQGNIWKFYSDRIYHKRNSMLKCLERRELYRKEGNLQTHHLLFTKKTPEDTNTSGENTDDDRLSRMQSGQDSLGTGRSEISLDDSDSIWKARIRPWSVNRKSCIYRLYRGVPIKCDLYFSILGNLRLWWLYGNLIRLSRLSTRIGISLYRTETVGECVIPIRSCDGDLLFSSSLRSREERTIRSEIISRVVDTNKYQKCEDRWDPLRSLMTCMSLDGMFHNLFTKRAK